MAVTLMPQTEAFAEEAVIIEEDFSFFTAGSEETPDFDNVLCNYYNGNLDPYIDDTLTTLPGWSGTQVYQAGGIAALKSINDMTGAVLNTPQRDFSGELNISLRLKPLSKYTELDIVALTGYIGRPENADADVAFTPFVFSEDSLGEWITLTHTITNYSANTDGFIQFIGYGTLLLDDIRITSSSGTLLAPPQVMKPTDFTDDSFTAHWSTVRGAEDYYFRLYVSQPSDEEEKVINFGFEEDSAAESQLPDDWTLSRKESHSDLSGDTLGSDESRGLVLCNGDILQTPLYRFPIKEFAFWGKGYYPSEDIAENDYESMVAIEVYDGEDWTEIGLVMLAGFAFDPGLLDLFADMPALRYTDIYGVRLTVNTFKPDAFLVVDDFDITIGTGDELIPVLTTDGMEYTVVEGTSHTVTGLDCDKTYYYRIQAHREGLEGNLTSYNKVFGVAAPVLSEPSYDKDSDSMTLNWNAVAHATSYRVANFGVRTVDTDNEE
ncbi:MAG: hypothetical protein K2H75_08550 [Muribaculaceae bacterium]|nr:hypothetical protein [Muribaculaceae bacterium]